MLKVRCSRKDQKIFFYENVADRAIHYRGIFSPTTIEEYDSALAKLAEKGVAVREKEETIVDYAKITLTRNCFLKCLHCYVSGGELKDTISKDFMLKIIDSLADAGVVNIRFTGGEPLLRPDIFEILDRAYRHDMFIHLTTNSLLLNEENVLKIKGYDPILSTSLDGPDIESHEAIRGPNTFLRTVDAIKLVRQNEITLRVNTTLNKWATPKLTKMFHLLRELNVRDWGLLELIHSGRAERNDYIIPDFGDTVAAVKNLREEIKKYDDIEVHGYLLDILNESRSIESPQCKDYSYRVDIETVANPNEVGVDTLPWPHRKIANIENFESILREQCFTRENVPYQLPSTEVCSPCEYRFKCAVSPYSKTINHLQQIKEEEKAVTTN